MADAKRVLKREPGPFQRQRRGIITRSELIRSARHIFARDGFEHARIEDIAMRARKTRGAFYDNFKDKEDVFLAIFEEDVFRDLIAEEPGLSETFGFIIFFNFSEFCSILKNLLPKSDGLGTNSQEFIIKRIFSKKRVVDSIGALFTF